METMKYYLFDRATNLWSEKLYTLQELLAISGLKDSSMLATEDAQTTLTLAEAKASELSQLAGDEAMSDTASAPRPKSLNLVVCPRPVAAQQSSGKPAAANPGSVAENIVKNMKQQSRTNTPTRNFNKMPKLFGDPDGASSRPVTKEYKVLSQKDKWYSGKFDPDMLETALNDYARMGYHVVCSSTATIQSLTGAREEIIIILERDKQ